MRQNQAAGPLSAAAPLALRALPARPTAGQLVRLVVLDPPAEATDYKWDLVGRGSYRLDTGSVPRASELFAAPGIYRVGVRVADGVSTRVVTLTVTVGARRVRAIIHVTSAPGARPHQTPLRRPRAHAAGDPGVTIADFQFRPSSVTAHAGETVTWTNNGPSAHTATARDGSFHTGVLQKGASASHTFTQPGTFAYYCAIHPFMRGTIVVLAAASPTTPATSSSSGGGRSTNPSPTTASQASRPASSAQTLPITGLEAATPLVSGIVLIGVGLTLRRALCR